MIIYCFIKISINTVLHMAFETYTNKKTPVISRSLFINQKTNSHDNCCYGTQFTISVPTFPWKEVFAQKIYCLD